jgi:AbrB family looped-hinge helix DNA binding protein
MTIRVTKRYQVLIPREVRDRMALRPGTTLAVFEHEGRIVMVPIRPMKELRGAFKGMNTRFVREPYRI